MRNGVMFFKTLLALGKDMFHACKQNFHFGVNYPFNCTKCKNLAKNYSK